MYISVVIPAYNLLEDCISALSPSVQQPDCEYEVIVSDDKRNSGTKQLLEDKYAWAIWVEGPHKGVAANRNNGVKYAHGEWIVFIDNDCIPDKSLINNYINAVQNNPNILVFEGCIKPNRPKKHFLEEAPINEVGGYFWTCNVMIQRDYFVNVLHGFDEDFYMYGEDVDIRERIKQTNQPIIFIKEAYCIHPWRIPKDILNLARQKRISSIPLYFKHPHLRGKKSLYTTIKNELRFYIKDVLFHTIPYRGRGLFTYIHLHIIANKSIKKEEWEYKNNEKEWTKFY